MKSGPFLTKGKSGSLHVVEISMYRRQTFSYFREGGNLERKDRVNHMANPSKAEEYFRPLIDAEVPAEHRETLAKYRRLAEGYGVKADTSLCCRVRNGFTLKIHAPEIGPCQQDFQYLQVWKFQDEPTSDCLVFWVPRLIDGSVSKTKHEQARLLVGLQQKFDLPKHHLTTFGQASLVAGLILTHHDRTGEKIPFEHLYVRTDTSFISRRQLGLGGFRESRLHCAGWFWDGWKFDGLGVLALGIEQSVITREVKS